MKKYLSTKVSAALVSLQYCDMAKLTFEKPRQESHGDLTTNIAMSLAKAVGKNPRALAQEIVGALKLESDLVSGV